MVVGMSAFGIPIGVAAGTVMDNKAFKEGRQLDFENDYK